MTLEQFEKQFFDKNIEIMKKKNHDYSGYSTDPFANFKAVALVSVDPIDGFLTRMMDKIARIKTFKIRGKLLVADENAVDTLGDLANYAMLLAGFLEEIRTREDLVEYAEKFFNININIKSEQDDLELILINVSKQIWARSNATVFLQQLAWNAMRIASKS